MRNVRAIVRPSRYWNPKPNRRTLWTTMTTLPISLMYRTISIIIRFIFMRHCKWPCGNNGVATINITMFSDGSENRRVLTTLIFMIRTVSRSVTTTMVRIPRTTPQKYPWRWYRRYSHIISNHPPIRTVPPLFIKCFRIWDTYISIRNHFTRIE